jgi:hypothetical protein
MRPILLRSSSSSCKATCGCRARSVRCGRPQTPQRTAMVSVPPGRRRLGDFGRHRRCSRSSRQRRARQLFRAWRGPVPGGAVRAKRTRPMIRPQEVNARLTRTGNALPAHLPAIRLTASAMKQPSSPRPPNKRSTAKLRIMRGGNSHIDRLTGRPGCDLACSALRHFFGHCIDTRSAQRGAVVRVSLAGRAGETLGDPSGGRIPRTARQQADPPPRLAITQQLAIERHAGGQHQRSSTGRRATAGVTDPNLNRTARGPLRPSPGSHASARNHRRRNDAACTVPDHEAASFSRAAAIRPGATDCDDLIERARPAARELPQDHPATWDLARSAPASNRLERAEKTRARQAEL